MGTHARLPRPYRQAHQQERRMGLLPIPHAIPTRRKIHHPRRFRQLLPRLLPKGSLRVHREGRLPQMVSRSPNHDPQASRRALGNRQDQRFRSDTRLAPLQVPPPQGRRIRTQRKRHKLLRRNRTDLLQPRTHGPRYRALRRPSPPKQIILIPRHTPSPRRRQLPTITRQRTTRELPHGQFPARWRDGIPQPGSRPNYISSIAPISFKERQVNLDKTHAHFASNAVTFLSEIREEDFK